MRVLVTGGAGFIGSNLVDRLVAHGHEVLAVDDLSSGRLHNLDEARRDGRVNFHRFDIRSEGMRDVITQSKPEIVYHLAAQPSVPESVKDPLLDAGVNVMGLLNVLEASVAAGVRKFVFSSSGGTIYGDQKRFPIAENAQGRPSSPYGITKRVAEDYVRYYRVRHGLDFTSLALGNVYGPRQRPHGESSVVAIFATKLLAGEAPTITGSGANTRDYVYVDDVAHAFVLASEKGSGETFNIGTGVETSDTQLAETMIRAAGLSLEPLYGPARPGDLPRNALDPSKAGDGLGWKPWTSLEQGLKETIEWFRGQPDR